MIRMPRMPFYIEMQGMSVLIAGGGQVALRKLKSMLAAGAEVRVVAPAVAPEIRELAASRAVVVRDGRYSSSDLDGVFLAVAATDDTVVNRQIAEEAIRRGILVSVADDPEFGNCTFPALLRRGRLEIGVSTGGRSPGFAVAVRDMLAEIIDERFAEALDSMASVREKLLTGGKASQYNIKVLREQAKHLITGLIETDKESVK
jgi:precorrin-2 dehydrogenase/sirohydrochlorin ferrochelatase